MRRCFLGLLVAALAIAAAAPAYAQGGGASSTGTIQGRVTDAQGAVLPGVTVTATSPSALGAQTTISSEAGNYRFPGIPPGVYTVTYELPGFNTVRREGIQIALGFTATLNIEMALATLQDEAGRALDPRVVGAFIALMPALLAEGVPEAAPRAIGPGTGATAFPANRTLPPPKADARSEKGAVTARVIRLTMTLRMMPPTLNWGSSSDPLIGRSTSMTPLRSFISATARSTGALIASGLSTLSPKVSWLRIILFCAVSFRFSTRYLTLNESLPLFMP